MRRAINDSAFLLGVLVAFMLFLPGCAWFNGPSIDTERKAIVVASAELRGGYLLLESLITTRTVDARNARKIKTALDKANSAVDVAWAALKVSDLSKTSAALGNFRVALDVALAILGEYAVENST